MTSGYRAVSGCDALVSLFFPGCPDALYGPGAPRSEGEGRQAGGPTRPIFLPIFTEIFGLSWETPTLKNYHPEDSKKKHMHVVITPWKILKMK